MFGFFWNRLLTLAILTKLATSPILSHRPGSGDHCRGYFFGGTYITVFFGRTVVPFLVTHDHSNSDGNNSDDVLLNPFLLGRCPALHVA